MVAGLGLTGRGLIGTTKGARSFTRYGAGGTQKAVTVGPPAYADDAVIQAVANVLLKSSKFHQAGITAILEPYGATDQSVSMALQLVAGGTSHVPNARLKEHGASLDLAVPGIVRKVRDAELYPRAAYVVAAALRMQKLMDKGLKAAKALGKEAVYHRAHEFARKGRLLAAAQVQVAMKTYGWATEDRGTLVGWYLNPLLNNDAECIAANGNNFYAEEGTIIGLPGAVHPNCGCYAGPPHIGGELVNEVLSKVAVLDHHRTKKVRLRKKTKKEGA